MEHGKPLSSPFRQVDRKENCWGCGHRRLEKAKATGWNIHYIRHKTDGGKNMLTNLTLLHPNCHRQIHNREMKVTAGSADTGFMEA
jgi:hypothetical protein